MALSNAEKQAAWRQRQKDRLANAVTPEEVVEAARLLHQLEDVESAGTFEEWLIACRKMSGQWRSGLPEDPDATPADFSEFSKGDADLLARVSRVVASVLNPPKV